MSVEQNVFLRRMDMPSPTDWQAAISDAGFALAIDTDFSADSFDGFLPCQYQGIDCGFEYFAEDFDLAEAVGNGMLSDDEAKGLGDRVFLVTLVTHSSVYDALAAAIASAVLTSISDEMLAEGGDVPFIPGDRAIAWVKKVEPEYLSLAQSSTE